jgi:hypothetical protein
MREEVVRQRVEEYDADAGVAEMLHDYHEAQFVEGHTEEEPEATAKVVTTCLPRHRNPFMDRQRFLNWMPLDA